MTKPTRENALLFEQAAMSLVKEMPVLAVSRHLEITDKRLWRIVRHYVGRMLGKLDLSHVATVGVDETASQRGQRYVTVFLDLQRKQEPVIFAVPGHGKDRLEQACVHALAIPTTRYASVASILKQGLDRQPLLTLPEALDNLPPHTNVRGAEYYH